MRKILPLIALLALSSIVLVTAAPTRAADGDKPKAKPAGTIKVTVKDDTGNVVSGATVSVLPRVSRKNAAEAPATKPAADATAVGKRKGAEPVSEGITDEKGIATLSDVPVGNYNVTARVKKVGSARGKVTVTADAPAEVTLELKAAKKK